MLIHDSKFVSKMSAKVALIVTFVVLITSADSYAQDTTISMDEARSRLGWVGTDLHLVIDARGATPTYSGKITLSLEAETSLGPILMLNNRDASMRLTDLSITPSSDLPTYNIENDIPTPTEQNASLSRITFDEPVEKGASIEVLFSYEFFAEQGQVLSRPSEGFEDWTPLHYASWVTGWYPEPISDSSTLFSAAALSIQGTTSFLLPEKWNALSNGKLVTDKIVGREKHQTWNVGAGIPRSYIAAPFTVSSVSVGDIDVAMYMLNSDKEAVSSKANLIVKIIELLEEKFGDYPFDTFAIAEIPDETTDYFSASSEQGFIVAEANNFVGNEGLSLFAHEAGHSWWGNRFSCTGSGSSLCSEALAQLGAVLANELVYGNQMARDFMEVSVPSYIPSQSARGFFAFWRMGDVKPLSQIEGGWAVHGLMDSKGMWFWQMLREEVGDEKFFRTLRSLSNGELSLSLVELETYFSNQTDTDLGYFFDQWLNRAGAPIIDMNWVSHNSKGENPYVKGVFETFLFSPIEGKQEIKITLTQEHDDLYQLKPEIEFSFYHQPPVRKTLEFSEKQQTYVFEFEGIVRDVVLDPEHKILMWRPAYGPKPAENIAPVDELEDK